MPTFATSWRMFLPIGLEIEKRQLKLPTFLREYENVAAEVAREGLDHVATIPH
jgi:hypothetical protein